MPHPHALVHAVAALAAVLGVGALPAHRPALASPVCASPAMEGAGGAVLPCVIAPLLDAVVNITTLKPPKPHSAEEHSNFLSDRKWERGYGSGFIIAPTGLLVTNRHVLEDAVGITVTLHDERQFPARLVASNTTPDLALLQIEAPGERFATVRWGDSEALRLGETVIAVGNPLGLTTSITVGVVSALGRNVRSSPMDDYIQTDAAINRGSSGGPLFNLAGEVVGVHWAMITPHEQSGSVGLGLVIPSEIAAPVVDEMRRHGRLRPGFPGMLLQPLSPDLARVMGVPHSQGGIVAAVSPGGPAERAGIREGDVVLRFGAVAGEDSRAMLREIWRRPPGTALPVRLRRGGREMEVEVVLGTFPGPRDPVGPSPLHDVGPPADERMLGLRVSELNEATRRAFAISHARPGLVVEGVAANSSAARLGLSRGDLVLRVGDAAVPTAETFAAALARHRGADGVAMQVEMDRRVQWIVVPPIGTR
jgi:serine protease Do